jgi:hypothetical protein
MATPADAEDQGEGEAEGEQTQDRLEQAPPPVAGRQLPRLHEVADPASSSPAQRRTCGWSSIAPGGVPLTPCTRSSMGPSTIRWRTL